jgi:putative PIN family toxin of toxin-antitoxin system
VRVVLDANVIVSALISRSGAPAQLVQLWLEGEYELVVCEALIAEVERALAYLKLRKRIAAEDAAEVVRVLREVAEVVPDPDAPPPVRSPDAADDYLLALAARERVPLVSGDADLLGLGQRLPILTPRQFLEEVERP